MSKPSPEIHINILEARDLFDSKTYWKKYNRFSAYCVVEFLDNKKKTKDVTAEEKSCPTLPPWNENVVFKPDRKKLNPPLIIILQVWQKKFKEWYESSKDVMLGTFQIPIDKLMDNHLYDNWLALPKGTLHISILLKDCQVVAPAPQLPPQVPQQPQLYMQPNMQAPPQYMIPGPGQFNPQMAPPQQVYYVPISQQSGYMVQPVPLYPPVQIYPNAPPQDVLPPAYSQQPAPPQNGNFPYLASIQQPITQPMQPTPQQAPPQQPSVASAPPMAPTVVAKPPPVPPKVQLPHEIAVNTVVANSIRSTQVVPDKVLNDYFKFCGTILHFIREPNSPISLICFSKSYEADTAVFLDNGMVCGGPIEVTRYKDALGKLPDSMRPYLDKSAKRLADLVEQSPQEEKPKEVHEAPMEESKLYPVIESTGQSIFVKNISMQAKVDVVVDFFSYCGTVHNVALYKGETSDSQCATVYFGSKEATTTALLLSGAHIYDKAIVVEQLSPEKEKQLKQQKAVDSSETKTSKLSSEQNSKSSVVASLVAAGYNVGSSVVHQAKRYDEKHFKLYNTMISAKENAMAKLSDLDSKYELSKKAEKSRDAVVTGFKGALGSLGITKQEKPAPNKDTAKYT